MALIEGTVAKPEQQWGCRRGTPAQMSKITSDNITWFGTGFFVAVPIWQQWGVKLLQKFSDAPPMSRLVQSQVLRRDLNCSRLMILFGR